VRGCPSFVHRWDYLQQVGICWCLSCRQSAFCLLSRLVALTAFSPWTLCSKDTVITIPTIQIWLPSVVLREPGRTSSTLIRMGIIWAPIVVRICRDKVFILHTLRDLAVTVHSSETNTTETSHKPGNRSTWSHKLRTLKMYTSTCAHQPKWGTHMQRSMLFTSAWCKDSEKHCKWIQNWYVVVKRAGVHGGSQCQTCT